MIQPDEKTEKNTERLQCSIAYNSLCLPCDSVCWLFKTSSSLSCIKSLTDLSSCSECCPRNLLKSSKVLSSLKRNSSTKGSCFSTDCNSVVTLSSRRRDSPRIFTWEVMTRANQSKDKFAKRANENSEKTKVAGSSAGKCKWSSPYFFFFPDFHCWLGHVGRLHEFSTPIIKSTKTTPKKSHYNGQLIEK